MKLKKNCKKGDDVIKMPGGDGTGPAGLGPMTGRALGYCAGYSSPGYTKGPGLGWGRGYGRGWWGRGRGWWRGIRWGTPVYNPWVAPGYPTPTAPVVATPADQLTMLKQEKEYMESELKAIQEALEDISKRIEEIEQEK
ncbi:MAG: DUF5320 domain-containing protein [Promethearchaeota archaeon]